MQYCLYKKNGVLISRYVTHTQKTNSMIILFWILSLKNLWTFIFSHYISSSVVASVSPFVWESWKSLPSGCFQEVFAIPGLGRHTCPPTPTGESAAELSLLPLGLSTREWVSSSVLSFRRSLSFTEPLTLTSLCSVGLVGPTETDGCDWEFSSPFSLVTFLPLIQW